MTLFLSRKQALKVKQGDDIHITCLELEKWAGRTEAQLGIQTSPTTNAYTDVPIGGLVASNTGPSVQTSYSTAATIFTVTATLVKGHQYIVTLCAWGQQITAGTTQAQVFASDSAGLINGAGFLHGVQASLGVNSFTQGSQTKVLVPTTTVSDVFTVQASSAAASFQINAMEVDLQVIRVK